MQPHQQRVLDEKRELDEKISKLIQFFPAGTFLVLPRAEQERLRRQETVMLAYSDILGERIAAFPKEVPSAE